MRRMTKRTAGGIAVMGGVVLLRPGTGANHALRHQVDLLARRLRHVAGRLHGLSYRLRGRHPDPDAADNLLADRIRSSLGPLKKRLDLPHIHLMAEGHIALLHGEVGTQEEADEIEAAVAAVSGVLGVESYLHIGLASGDTRPSEGQAAHEPSEAWRRPWMPRLALASTPRPRCPSSGPSWPPSPNDCRAANATTSRPTYRPTSGPCSRRPTARAKRSRCGAFPSSSPASPPQQQGCRTTTHWR